MAVHDAQSLRVERLPSASVPSTVDARAAQRRSRPQRLATSRGTTLEIQTAARWCATVCVVSGLVLIDWAVLSVSPGLHGEGGEVAGQDPHSVQICRPVVALESGSVKPRAAFEALIGPSSPSGSVAAGVLGPFGPRFVTVSGVYVLGLKSSSAVFVGPP